MSWVLVIFVYVGIWGDTDSVSVTTTPMSSKEVCEEAGKSLDSLVSGTKKEVRYVCVRNQ